MLPFSQVESMRRAQQPPDGTPEELLIARALLGDGIDPCAVGQMEAPVRRYLNGLNLADDYFVRYPLLRGLHDADVKLFPHHFVLRDRQSWRDNMPKLEVSASARRELALEFMGEALNELRDFLVNNDLNNNRLVSAVAGAIRGELARLVAYIDAGCPALTEEDLAEARASAREVVR